VDIWPGFVDALASVLIVFVFMLLIFVVVQFFMTDILVDRDKALDRLTLRINELADTLSMEREESAILQHSLDQLTAQLSATLTERDSLSKRLLSTTQRADAAAAQVRQLSERLDVAMTTVSADKQKIELRLQEIASLQQDLLALRQVRSELENQVGALADWLALRDAELSAADARSQTLEARLSQLGTQLKQREDTLSFVRDRSKTLEAKLAEEQERTHLAQAEIDKRDIRLRELATIVANSDRELVEHKASLTQLTVRLETEIAERDRLSQQLTSAEQRAETNAQGTARLENQLRAAETTISADKERIELQLREIASLQRDLQVLRELRAQLENEVGRFTLLLEQRDKALSTAGELEHKLESRIGDLEAELSLQKEEALATRDRSKSLEARLADERERTRLVQVDIDKRDIRLRELASLVAAADLELVEQKDLGERTQAQVALLNQQIVALREQIAGLSKALELSELSVEDYKVKVADLGERLNIALAERVQELHKYRSEFFGRLREVLGDHPDIRIVGDRFLFQSELLFPSGSADLEIGGKQQLDRLAETLKTIAETIPSDVDWILRVDGHTDRRPIRTEKFPSNWELSTARALSIVAYLIEKGISPSRLAAAGFGEFHPIDGADTSQAYSRNRRIEIKFTGP
jgi:chemotaxis protein MotB